MMKEKIALITSFGLGDSLIFLIIANNLQRNGYEVTCYSNMLVQMQSWIPNVKCLPFPDIKPDGFDLILSDANSILTKNKNLDDAAKDAVFFSMAGSRSTKKLYADHAARLKHTPRLARLANASGMLLKHTKDNDLYCPENNMVENTVIFCREVLMLDNATPENGITPPADLLLRKHQRRVIIHPLSTNEQKNWSAKQYLALAEKLKQKGFEPVFITSPKERETWESLVNGKFELPLFPSIAELAAFVYESGYMIGNDSGIGHLASNLGLPTISIYNSRDHYRWRPGWSEGIVIKPCWLWRLFPKSSWRRFISVRRVLNTFSTRLHRDCRPSS
jgi:heptosyltransferase III